MNDCDDGILAYPVSLNLKRKKCLVVGGGKVACRKVETLLEFGPELITVVSPSACAELQDLFRADRAVFKQRSYLANDLDGIFIVIVATDDPAVNAQVSQDARSRGVLVNVADDAGLSDFILPSHFRRGGLIVAVSTSGRSPALARKIKEKLSLEIDETYAELMELVSRVRCECRTTGVPITSEGWNLALDIDNILSLLREGKRVEAESLLKNRLTEATDS